MTKITKQFKRSQKVVAMAVDPRWNEAGTICSYESKMTFYATGEHYPGWYIVKYARDGRRACIHESQLQAA